MATLLVVDDEPNIVFSLRECLGSEMLRVVSAGTAREGEQLAAKLRPDVVLLDVRLPDMSGLDAFDRIHAIDQRLPVIMITAYGKTETAIEAMRRGAYEFLLKPVDFRQLREVVAKALEVSRLNRVATTMLPPIGSSATLPPCRMCTRRWGAWRRRMRPC
jgi:DNA-binding NtrC family response regulator